MINVNMSIVTWLRTQDDPVAPPINLGVPDTCVLQLRLHKLLQRFTIHIQCILKHKPCNIVM